MKYILALALGLALVSPASAQTPKEVKVGEEINMNIRNREPIMMPDFSIYQFDQPCRLRFGGGMFGLGVLDDRTLIVYKNSRTGFSAGLECPTKAIGLVPTSYFTASQAKYDEESTRRKMERNAAEEEGKIIEQMLKTK